MDRRHGNLNKADRPRMPGRTSGNGGASWRRALALSFALHAAALLAIGIAARTTVARADPLFPLSRAVTVDVEAATLVDLVALDAFLGPAVEPAPPAPQSMLDLSTAPPADRALAVPTSQRSPVAGGADRRSPASDRGAGPGRAAEDPAWRRDDSTLHERLSDGAERYQPSHMRTASRATSPQAVRRENRTGLGDSARTRAAQQAPAAAGYGLVEQDQRGQGSATTKGPAAEMSPVTQSPAIREAQRTIQASSQGPLDAEQGPRSFDVEAPGLVAADNGAIRSASHEDHPGITDLTLAGVSGNASEGRGPSDTPGAVAIATVGKAPAPSGVRGVLDGTGDQQRTQERIYDRYKQEIKARVNRALVWPRALAIRLEQGETILRFVVRPDGKLGDGIQVIKSSGFAEFDAAALDAVRKALPFPPMPNAGHLGPLAVTLRVPFSNPVIR